VRILVTGGSGFIGTNLIDSLTSRTQEILNVDVESPPKGEHAQFWSECDVLDVDGLNKQFQGFRPETVIHLAAKTDTKSRDLRDYLANTEGTSNLLEAVGHMPTVSRLIIASTQFTCEPGYIPQHDEDFRPHTAYGESKAIAEKLLRAAELQCTWTIVRPTNVWGPWHPRYPSEFWYVLKRGWYFHPRTKQPVVRSYGYVGNVVWQIERLLSASPSEVDRRVFYVGDRPMELLEWVNEFSLAIAGERVRIVPTSFMLALALVGSVLASVGVKFPINLSRFRSMTQNYVVPMEPTFAAFGEPPFSLSEGVNHTIKWLEHEQFFSSMAG